MPSTLLGRSDFELIPPGESHWVSLRYFCLTRLAIAVLLLVTSTIVADHMLLGEFAPGLFLRTLLVYIPSGTGFLLLAVFWPRRFYAQLAAQLVVDLVALTLLMYASGGPRSGTAALFLLPVAGAAILGPSPLALFSAALSSLAILGESAWRELTFPREVVNFVQAGLYGASSFATALVMSHLAGRLLSQERIARQRGQALRSQIEINRAVVAVMQDGVLVLSPEGEPRSLNPAAARLLHVEDVSRLAERGWAGHPVGAEITRSFLAWRGAREQRSASVEIVVSGNARDTGEALAERRLRVRFTPRSAAAGSGDYVVFLEDLQHFEERAQQLKLASMGRLTASIAHEIRNPLAAISHATALIAEEEPDPGLGRLLRIVQDNTVRLNRIVENILQLSRRAPVERERIELAWFLQSLLHDFCQEQSCAPEAIVLTLDGRPETQFNREHLRAVLFNLLQNAHRHASGKPGCVQLGARWVARDLVADAGVAGSGDGEGRIEITVGDDGPGIASEVRQHLFEPFYTTHSRGTSLGLYLARELCIANGAALNYVPETHDERKGQFVISGAVAND